MRISIVGTGNMARRIATRALAGGNDVTLVGTERGKAEALAGELGGSARAGDRVEAGSAAQEIAGAAPDGAKVVKAFNARFAATLLEGRVAGQPLDVFIAGDDDDAKATVRQLIEGGGLRAVDAGPLARARGLEALGYLRMTPQQPLDTGFGSAVKVIA